MTRLYDRHSCLDVATPSTLLRAVFLALTLSLSATGCTHTVQKPPTSPLLQTVRDDRFDHEQELDIERRHLAPPPAYGNKVVLAEEGQLSRIAF